MQEANIEQLLIDLLIEQWYTYHLDRDIAPGSDNEMRTSFEEMILSPILKDSLKKLNPDADTALLDEAYRKITHLEWSDIVSKNENFHKLMRNGCTIERFKDWETRWEYIRFFDLEKIENNDFRVVNQFKVSEDWNNKRFDVVIFINWIPVVLCEMKNPLDPDADMHHAFTQIQNYQTAIPSFFQYNGICMISDWLDTKVSSFTAPYSRYQTWKNPWDFMNKWDKNWTTLIEWFLTSEIYVTTKNLFDKETLLNVLANYTVFENEEKKDKKTWQITQEKIKKVAAYHQYYAVKKAISATLHAMSSDHKIWVIRHTQWSWKSLSMVFYVWQLVTHPEMRNPTVLVITDRNDLDDQLYWTFANSRGILRQTPQQATDRENLKELLKVKWWWIIFSTIQKFYPEEWSSVYETLSTRDNIIVIADEAHRSQYGFKARVVEKKNWEWAEIKYWNAKYLRDALPNASFIWFTGTPIEKTDRSTRWVFGDEIDIYDIQQSVEDGATVPINYESRLIKIWVDQEVLDKIEMDIEEYEWATEEQKQTVKTRLSQLDTLVWNPERLKTLAEDLVSHFETRQELFMWKAMFVWMTRWILVRLYDEIIKIRPNWGKTWFMKIIMTSSTDDPKEFQPHHTTSAQRKDLALEFKDPKSNFKLALVCDMWLTGFDVPCLHTMYFDKKMQWAWLMQAIARVNRVYKDKPGWLIVDYIWIAQDLRDAMAVYTQCGWKWTAVNDKEKTLETMFAKYEVVKQILHWYDWSNYFSSDTKVKLSVIIWAMDFVMKDEDIKNRYLKEVTALSQLFALVMPDLKAVKIRDDLAFFQAVKARITKIIQTRSRNYELETTIQQEIDSAFSTHWVVDIFEAAWLEKPSVDLLSDKFLLEVKNMKQKNLAFELLKRILNDEIRVRRKRNLAQSRIFSEMINDLLKRYTNNQLDTSQVIQELCEIAHELHVEDNTAEQLWLTPEEYAFYTVLSQNESTKFLEDEKMKELIHAIVEKVRKNATGLYLQKSDIQAQLRLEVKKLLMKYGYPPDLARMEADKVLEQSEQLAEEMAMKL